MKRKILLTFAFIVLGGILFFYYLNKRIEGVWISQYSMDLNGENIYYNGEALTVIKNQKIYSHGSGYDGIPAEKKYFDSGIRLIFRNTAWEKVSSINKDSLVIISGYDDDRIFKTILKKVPDSLKNHSNWNQKLLGKTFQYHLPKYNYTDTIYFDDQYILSKNQHIIKDWDSSQSWELAKVDGFDILYGGNWPTFILNDKGNGIKFYGFDKKGFFKAELNEINIDLSDIKNKLAEIEKEHAK